MSEKAQFGVLDVSPGAAGTDSDGNKQYMGSERRTENRRKYQERRGEVRFEPGKEDRRQRPGRREDDATSNFW